MARAGPADRRGDLGPLRGLSARHDLLAVEVLDPRELELPDIGLLTVVDPETGQTLEVPTGNAEFRARYAEGAAAQRARVAAALETLRRPERRRGLVVVISDFLGDSDWERPLRGLSARHELLAIEVVDPRELELPDVGLLTVVDPETGQTLELPTGNAEFRARFAQGAAEERARIAAALRRAGAGHLQLRTDRDWLMDVVRFVADRRRAGSGGASR